jgi:hypothetical protein
LTSIASSNSEIVCCEGTTIPPASPLPSVFWSQSDNALQVQRAGIDEAKHLQRHRQFEYALHGKSFMHA